jgi:hypothetical protein
MEQQHLLIEYLKEQYSQARQHETRQTTATSFLTGVAAVVLGFMLQDGAIKPSDLWVGILILLIGFANYWINRAHFLGNRFHTKLAGKTRRAIETSVADWIGKTPSQLREETLNEWNFAGPDRSVGKTVYNAMQLVPIGVVLIGIAVSILAIHSSR